VWKKEQSQTNTALIYGPLFREIKSIMNSARGFGLISGFAYLSHNQWDEIASDYLYYSIPQDLRNSLDRFFATLSTYSQLSLHINGSLTELILRQASQFYKTKVTQIDYYMDYMKIHHWAATERIPLENLVVYNQHPKEALTSNFSDRQSPKFRVSYFGRENGRESTTHLTTPEQIKSFDDFWSQVLEHTPKEQIAKMKRALQNSISDSEFLQDSILRLIREPWSS